MTSWRRHSDVVDLNPFVEDLRQQLLVAAEAGGDDALALAERLVAPLQASTRLVLLDALAAAAAEITLDLAPGSVDVRLRGRDPEFVVTSPPSDDVTGPDATFAPEPVPTATVARATAPSDAELDAGTSRVTLRLPEALKVRIEDAAGRDGLSVNAWLVRTLTGALDPTDTGGRGARRAPSAGDRYVGWVR
jgi:hypothetical protein